ncbi:protocadherin gamma-A11-like isoform X25 [Scyliorhinus canicula]|uniref:protocadherin gamma-A11-like isoform X25 n=1 Tax=Scyliorhinus canicula TaxID=7830 RepID=UPI0018F29C48|nr:protocadherin gamma-A11-like isoform X25 [Scyliorhinus canicula]
MRENKRFWLLRWSLLCCVCVCGQISREIRYSVPEELQLGAFVGNIADDLGLDLKELTARSFRIVPGHKKQYFDVNLNNGNLFVMENIDRENLCGPSATCLLSLETVMENPFLLHDVEVEILDVNDNAPTFPENQFRLEISEAAAPGARYPLESAHDPDIGSNSLQSYQLLTDENFVLNVESRNANENMPVLVLKRSLDRESVSHHRLVLIAKDAGVPERSGSAEIIISVQDANDNTPVFAKPVYNVSLLENVSKGTLVHKLNATDLDDGSNGEITYSFTSHTNVRVRELFSLDSKTGEVRIRGNLNYEENNLFEINVQAMDNGPYAVPAYCHVLVHVLDINDNAPEVTVSTSFSPVLEDSMPGTVVALISATDKDSGENGRVECQVTENLPFQLDSSSKKYLTLRTKQILDRENVSRYEVTVLCSDSGSPPLTSKKAILVEVSDINDNAPRFSQPLYTAYVTENNVIGASIISITAFDPDLNRNSRLNYSIQPTQVQGESIFGYVQINSEKGTIISQKSFDYETLRNLQIQVQVRDSGVPSLSSTASVEVVILDQNDNAPVIVHPLPDYGSVVTETVSRVAEPGYLVAKVSATDADSGQNARLSYLVLQTTEQGLFTISHDTGEIWTIRGIRSNDATKQRLVIGAKDNGSPALSATMTIILSLTDGDTEMLSDVSSLSEDRGSFNDVSLYLVISLGMVSALFLVVLIILAIKVHKNRNRFGAHVGYLDRCCCFEDRYSLNGIQKASRNLELGPNYVEVFGGDPLSQSFRYDTCSASSTVKRDTMFPDIYRSSACKKQVKQPNADWHFAQTHRAELNSAQYLEEEGVQREIQREVQREVQCDVQREVPRDVQCDVPHNIQREVQRDVQCDMQRVVEKDPGGPRKPMCARPVAIPAGRDGWTLPRTAPRMQLQMTLGAHVPGTLRSQYLIPRELHTSGARISNSSVEFSAPLIGSLHGPMAANQTRDHRGISSPGSRRPELDPQARGEIPCSPTGQRLSTQRLHSRDHDHALREVNY